MLRRLALLLSIVAPSIAGCTLLLGSGGSEPDGGPDQAPDASADASPPVCDNDWSLAGGGQLLADDRITAMAVRGCAVYVCGTYRGNFGGVEPALAAFGQDDIIVAKIEDGDFVWAKGMGTNQNDDRCHGIAVDSERVYVVGEFRGTMVHPNGTSTSDAVDGFLAAFNEADGMLAFFEVVDGPGTELVSAVAIDQNGSIVIGGYAASANASFATREIQTLGRTGLFTLRSGTSGDFIASRSFNGAMDSDDRIEKIIPLGDGLLIGATATETFAANECQPPNQSPENGGALVARLDASMMCVWAAVADSTSPETVTDLAIVEIAGVRRFIAIGTTLTSNLTHGQVQVQNDGGGNGDGFLMVLAENGVVLDIHVHGADGFTAFRSIAPRPARDEFVVLAYFEGDWPVPNNNFTAQGTSDLAALYFSTDDTFALEAAVQIGGQGTEEAAALLRRGTELVLSGAFDRAMEVGTNLLEGPTSLDFFAAPFAPAP